MLNFIKSYTFYTQNILFVVCVLQIYKAIWPCDLSQSLAFQTVECFQELYLSNIVRFHLNNISFSSLLKDNFLCYCIYSIFKKTLCSSMCICLCMYMPMCMNAQEGQKKVLIPLSQSYRQSSIHDMVLRIELTSCERAASTLNY